MRYIFSILLCAILQAGFSQIIKTVGVSYTNGTPTYTPAKAGSWLALDTVTWRYYTWNGSTWLSDGFRVQTISGCSAPAYTPTKFQSLFVINACTVMQGGPELYYWNGSAWVQINEGQTVSEPLTQIVYGTGSGITSDTSLTFDGTLRVKSNATTTTAIFEQDPTGKTGSSYPVVLIQDKPNTIYPPTRNTDLLFEVRANNSPPVGRGVFQVQAEGQVRAYDILTVLPSTLPIDQWFPDPSIFQVGSDLSGTPGATTMTLHNMRDSGATAQGGHPLLKAYDMNSGFSGIIPGEERFELTGYGALRFGTTSASNPAIIPYWPGNAYGEMGMALRSPNIAIRNTNGKYGSAYGGLYAKFFAFQDTLYYINSGGGINPFITRNPSNNKVVIENENEFRVYDDIYIGNKSGAGGKITSAYGGINFDNTKIGHRISPVFALDINSADAFPARIQSPTSIFDFRQNLELKTPGTVTGTNIIGNLPISTLNLWSTTAESDGMGASIAFGSTNKTSPLSSPYFYGQIHCSKLGATANYAGQFKFVTMNANSTSTVKMEINETEVNVINNIKSTSLTSAGNRLIFANSTGVLDESTLDPANILQLTSVFNGNFSGTGTATTAFIVTLSATQPDATYSVSIMPKNVLSATDWYISARSTTTFTVTYLTGLTGAVDFDYIIVN